MIKDNQKYFNRLQVLLDAIVVAGSYLISWWLKFEGPLADSNAGAYTMQFYFSALYFLVPGYLVLYYLNNMYTPKRTRRIETEITQVFASNIAGVFIFLVCIAIFKISDFSRGLIVIFSLICAFLMILERLVIRWVLSHIRSRGYNVKHIILVG